jgi:hypothetical protein
MAFQDNGSTETHIEPNEQIVTAARRHGLAVIKYTSNRTGLPHKEHCLRRCETRMLRDWTSNRVF